MVNGLIRCCAFCGDDFSVESKYSNRKFCCSACRFKSQVPQAIDGESCIEWTGGKTRAGYGTFNLEYSGRSGGRAVYAHRMSFEVFVRPLKDGERVCHSCDNPACINPAHLFAGSQLDNMRDMWAKGRQQDYTRVSRGDSNPSRRHPELLPRGVSHYAAKLTEDDVRAIRSSVESHAHEARKYGISDVSVCYIRARKTWKHVI